MKTCYVGQEYSLLLISTSENLDLSGRPFDQLKSFCHPAVFNTAITRARSLVVAVGNPLVLMMSEATMDEPKWCWKEFITRCLHNKSFVFPDCLKNKYSKVKDQLLKLCKIQECDGKLYLFLYIVIHQATLDIIMCRDEIKFCKNPLFTFFHFSSKARELFLH